jgi:hypothetical protein
MELEMKPLFATILVGLSLSFAASGAMAQNRGGSEEDRLVEAFDARVAIGDEIVTEIGAMAARDRLLREAIGEGLRNARTFQIRNALIERTRSTFERVDRQNSARLREILQAISWEQLLAISQRAADDAWSIISHSDDLEFKQEMLAQFEPLALSGRMPGSRYAMLYDDIAQMEGRPQRYATNFDCFDGQYRPRPTEDLEHVDERRASLGMEPLETYAARMRQVAGECPEQ